MSAGSAIDQRRRLVPAIGGRRPSSVAGTAPKVAGAAPKLAESEPTLAGAAPKLAESVPKLHAARVERARILLIERDRCLGEDLAGQLCTDGYRVELARTAQHARILAGGAPPTVVVLGELGSPCGALELLEEIRRRGDGVWSPALPVIVVSGEEKLDLLRAFAAGADDFLLSPPRYLELRLRLRALLKHSEQRSPSPLLSVGPLIVNVKTRCVTVHGERIALRRLEFALLAHLASDPDRVFSKQELLGAVWGYRASAATRTVESHASRLRRKLCHASAQPWVVNVWGVGYRLR